MSVDAVVTIPSLLTEGQSADRSQIRSYATICLVQVLTAAALGMHDLYRVIGKKPTATKVFITNNINLTFIYIFVSFSYKNKNI